MLQWLQRRHAAEFGLFEVEAGLGFDGGFGGGEIGAGHTVTALYELVPAGAAVPDDLKRGTVDALKYQKDVNAPVPGEPHWFDGLTTQALSGETMTVKLRYKDPASSTSQLLSFPARDTGMPLGAADEDFRFAAAVAQFGLLLRGLHYAGTATWQKGCASRPRRQSERTRRGIGKSLSAWWNPPQKLAAQAAQQDQWQPPQRAARSKFVKAIE